MFKNRENLKLVWEQAAGKSNTVSKQGSKEEAASALL